MTKLGSALTDSIKSEASTNLLVTVGDAGLDAAISSGALDGVPVFGIATGLWRAGKAVQQELFIRKVLRFLGEASKSTPEDRIRFVESLEEKGKKEEFGETILLILERADDATKPALIGRVMAAHVRGEIDYPHAMRLAAIVSRCYITDLEFLKTFKPGTQREMTPIADSLFSAGLLAQTGIDGGAFDDPLSGGTLYDLNEYGHLLLKYALNLPDS